MMGQELCRVQQEMISQVMLLNSLFEHSLMRALEAFARQNEEEAGAVIRSACTIDDLHTTVEERVAQVLSLSSSPFDRHLRALIALLPVTVDLERIGDDAKTIALFTLRLVALCSTHTEEHADPSFCIEGERYTEKELWHDIVTLGYKVWQRHRNTMQAFATADIEQARQLWEEEDTIDRWIARIQRKAMAMIPGEDVIQVLEYDPNIGQRATYLSWTASKLARIAGHCTSICEQVVFIVEGDTDMSILPD